MERAFVFGFALAAFVSSSTLGVKFSQDEWDAQIQANVQTVYDLTTLLSEGGDEDLEWTMTAEGTGQVVPPWTTIDGNTSTMSPVITDIRTWTYTLNVKEVDNPTETDTALIRMKVTARQGDGGDVFEFED